MSARALIHKPGITDIPALLLHHEADPLDGLQRVLDKQAIQTRRVRNCEEARRELASLESPHLLFTDTVLPDGNWMNVLALAAQASAPVAVIVVSHVVDIQLYLDVLDQGAADFIVAPFAGSDLVHIVRNVSARLTVNKR